MNARAVAARVANDFLQERDPMAGIRAHVLNRSYRKRSPARGLIQR
ncbi:MAG: hypothetical protein IPK15_19150 [Verrucomicrobia bacterium]|nr:hypothetical protein [Verrucomicrobiota bacterium]